MTAGAGGALPAADRRAPILILVGPTASGKSAAAIEAALALDGEVISADSMMVYRGLDIGTAKPSLAERRGVPHHCIDLVDPGHFFTVAEYREAAESALEGIWARGRVPLLVGGTGLYVRVLLWDFALPRPAPDPLLRERLARLAAEEGPAALHRRLAEVDPAAAGRIHPHDVKRVIRALEVYEGSGRPLSQWHQAGGRRPVPRFPGVWVGLTRDRRELYERIDRRVDAQVAAGLVEEARALLARYAPQVAAGHGPTALQALGYKELLPYLRGQASLAEALAALKRDTRRYAKRQLSWFRREPLLHWLDVTGQESGEIARRVVTLYREHAPPPFGTGSGGSV